MSAHAILSMIAPALPATLKGLSVADASGFGDLLARHGSLEAGNTPTPGAKTASAEADAVPGGQTTATGEETALPTKLAIPPVSEPAPLPDQAVPFIGQPIVPAQPIVEPAEGPAAPTEAASRPVEEPAGTRTWRGRVRFAALDSVSACRGADHKRQSGWPFPFDGFRRRGDHSYPVPARRRIRFGTVRGLAGRCVALERNAPRRECAARHGCW